MQLHFRAGLPIGKVLGYDPSGSLKWQATFASGALTGRSIVFQDGEAVNSAGMWLGMLHGHAMRKIAGGRSECVFAYGKLHGPQRDFDSCNNCYHSCSWENDAKVGEELFRDGMRRPEAMRWHWTPSPVAQECKAAWVDSHYWWRDLARWAVRFVNFEAKNLQKGM